MSFYSAEKLYIIEGNMNAAGTRIFPSSPRAFLHFKSCSQSVMPFLCMMTHLTTKSKLANNSTIISPRRICPGNYPGINLIGNVCGIIERRTTDRTTVTKQERISSIIRHRFWMQPLPRNLLSTVCL